jgi:hypothetical protein
MALEAWNVNDVVMKQISKDQIQTASKLLGKSLIGDPRFQWALEGVSVTNRGTLLSDVYFPLFCEVC